MPSPRNSLPNAASLESSASSSAIPLSQAQEQVLLHMQIRRLTRQLKGKQSKTKNTHHVALFVLLLCVYSLSASYMDNGTLTTTLTIQVWQMVAVGAWFLLIVILLSLLEDSIFFAAIVWMFVYWPLLAIITSILFTEDKLDPSETPWITIVFCLAQCLTLCIVVLRHYVYPKTLQSDWFKRTMGASRYWKALVTSTSRNNNDSSSLWTMTYQGAYHWTQLYGHSHRHSCQYEGDVDESTGLPHGSGRWIDDSHGGEILTGAWHQGKPVAPFLSRRYGTGDAFRAVPICYFLAADDEFEHQKMVPTNLQPAKCGVASVECSVQGAFYKHLPEATELYGPIMVPEMAENEQHDDDDSKTDWLQDCFRHMAQLVPEYDTCTSVAVSTSDPRGVQVLGHVFAPTNQAFSSETTEIVVRVRRDDEEEEKQGDDDDKDEDVEIDGECLDDIELGYKNSNRHHHHQPYHPNHSIRDHFARLEVQDWVPTPRKEALVFIPGFNSCLKRSLQTLGQLLAMTKISARVYPIVFEWPVAQVLTYRYASAIAATTRNKHFFLQLMRGLKAAGIDHVHFMSHSMGVQTLLGAFRNKDDGTSSEVSNCFRLADTDDGADEDTLMTCKSITMLNPDFPLAAFVDHAFLSIRRVCSHITIVGDRGDQALWYSQLINGSAKYFGYSQPDILNGTEDLTGPPKQFHQRVMGRHIDALHTAEHDLDEPMDKDKGKAMDQEHAVAMDHRMLFQKRRSQLSMATSDRSMDHRWLDVDVIDTTLLDTNIKDLRHSGFNVNPILLKDLEELIVTGRRAAERSTLLYREGNVFSYCHAPSFVTM